MTSHTFGHSKPTIHLTNFSSRKLHSGRVFSIMAAPRAWEHGAGRVWPLVPPLHLLRGVRAGTLPVADYFAELSREWDRMTDRLVPGALRWATREMGIDIDTGPVEDGDTLACACARGKPCHRVAAAAVLARAGWTVVLDGEVPDAG